MISTSDPYSTCPDAALEKVYEADWGRLLALLVVRTRRLDLAEDALSEAFARATERWRVDGVPDNPAGWLYTTAHRQLVGRLRAEAVAARKMPLLAVETDWVSPPDSLEALPDERLQLILLCCHPALSPESRSALALRLVLGTSTEQIARLFLAAPKTMAARLTRAKKKIALAGIPLAAPAEQEFMTRLDDVCRTVYLAFTAGYSPGSGPHLLRADVAGEAVRLAAVLHGLVPEAPQVQALLALLVLQHSRRDARQCDGQLVTLPDQDRSKWYREEISVGLKLVATVRPNHHAYAAELRLQAQIAAEHARAPSATDTDWAAIAGFYAELEALTGSAIVRLNRAVAVAEVEGPRAGLILLAELDPCISGHHRFAAVRAELARRAGDIELARASYSEAVGLCSNDVEREHLLTRLGTLDG